MKKYYIKNKRSNDINYCSAFESREDAINRLGLMFDVVVNKDRTIDLFKDGKHKSTVIIIEKDLNIYVADIGSGALVKAYFSEPEKALDFIYNTYDVVEYDIDDDLYRVMHKGIYIGTFEILGGV